MFLSLAYNSARTSNLLASLAILLVARRAADACTSELLAFDFAQKLLLASANHERVGHKLRARLLRDCASRLLEARSLEDEDFLRLYFLKVLAV